MNWYRQVLRQYAVFGGRARRKEYWFFVLFNLMIAIVLPVIDRQAGLVAAGSSMGLLGGLYSLAVLIPSVAVGVRRLHDTNRSGWWLLISFVPLIGALVLLFFLVSGGTAGNNDYGVDPKAVPEPA